MSGIKDTATVTLNVNGSQAKQMMSDLEAKIKQTEATITSLKAKMADPKDIEKARKQLTTYKKQLDEMKSATEGVNKVLGNLDSASPRQLEKALRTLNAQLKNMPPGTEVWDSHVEKIKEIKARLSDIREELQVQESWWSKLKGWVNDSGATILALGLGADAVVDTLRGFVDAYASMDQEMANVRKFTGLTEAQVADLNEEFKKMDTRTSREGLNQLAQEAGRLGKTSKEDIMGFVRAADQINVALDDLGEGATLTLSKLTGVFGDEERYGTEQSLLKVGSVINELSQNCSASASYLAQFASRMGGVGAQAKMTIPQIMAFGAVLDSNGQQVEASSTALSQVIVRMMQESAKYARVAGLDVKKFSDMLKTDVNGALILFLETLQQAGGMDTLSPMFKDMGENGSRAIAALSTLATHIDQVKAQQQAANVAFAEGTSVSKEAAVQNGTVQASIEKAKKALNDLRVELGERLSPLMSHMISSSSAVTHALITIVKFIDENKTAVISLSVAVVTYNAILFAYNTRTALAAKATALFNGALKLFRGVLPAVRLLFTPLINAVQYFTNGLEVNYAMQERWRKSMAAMKFTNWIGLVLALGAAVYTLVDRWRTASQEAERARKEQEEFKKSLTDIDEASSSYCANEISRLESLYKAAKDEAKSKDERRKAAEQLQSLYPAYFKNLSTEEIMVGNTKSAYDKLRASIIEVARARAAAAKIEENESKRLTLEQQEAALRQKRDNARKNYNSAKVAYDASERRNGVYSSLNNENVVANQDAGQALNQLHKSQAYFYSAEKDLMSNLAMQKQLIEANNFLQEKYNVSTDALAKAESANVPNLPGGGSTSGGGSRGGSGGAAVDRFAEETEWREQQEASARISYATGLSDYVKYTDEMDRIAVEFYEKQLLHTDLSETERLKITASWREAQKKQQEHAYAQSVEAENSAYNSRIAQLKQFYIDGSISKDTYDLKIEEAEIEHQRRLVALTKADSEDRAKAEAQLQDMLLSQTQRKQQQMEKLQQKYAEIKNRVFGLNQDEKDAEFTRQLGALKTVCYQELAAVGDNEAEKLRIKEAYMAAELALRKEYNQAGAEDTTSAYEAAVSKAAEWLQGEGGQALTGALSTLTSGMSSVFSGLSSLIQAELEIQTAELEKHYEREVELAQGNTYKVAKLEKKKEADIAKLKNEANKKMFAMQVIQAVAQTAQNALSAYGSAAAIPVVGYILAPIAAAMAVAAGAIQIASIKKQQQAAETKGYSEGGFTKPGGVHEPAGIVHAGEWVASQKLLSNPVARPMIEALDYAQRTNTIGSLRSDDVSRSITANNSLVRIAEGNDSSALMVAAAVRLSQTVDSLTGRLNEPFVTVNTVTGDKGIKQAQDEYTRLMNNITPKSKRKK